ncbi:Mu transposase C-terminal domain-containing protein [Lonepinella sp. BR2474]|uniref:Mu transposase C-terminal domain-containing protein n=1 Tax=Lonepinella sp. BR2474 TaxID=3434548 RepID=UPI003F6E2191
MKQWYSSKELAGIANLPKQPSNVTRRATKENWKKRQVGGVKGVSYEYALDSLPESVQMAIRERFVRAVVADKPRLPVVRVREVDLASLTAQQRAVADARMALVVAVLELEQSMSRQKAIHYFCEQAKCGAISGRFMGLVQVANAKNGNGSGRVLSPRTLHDWVLRYVKAETPEDRLMALVPLQRQATSPDMLGWLPEFLAVYRQTNGVCVAEAYDEFAQRWHEAFWDQPLRLAMLPSLSTVRRGLAKLPAIVREVGRKTGAELRAMKTYVKRDWSGLRANDVWVGDGHSMKMKVAHPEHGRPFIPEVTLVMDAASRFIVGWSVSLAENCLAVADAIRSGVEQYGLPAIYYSDNGGGEKNWMLDGDITGILPRLGINHQTGIPGNPQGRGIIERLNKTLLLRIARQFETYHGLGADRETVRKTSTAVVSLDKAIRQGRTELTDKQQWAKGKLPSWHQFIDAVAEGVRWYNEEHVHGEIGTTPARKYAQLLDGEAVLMISKAEARDLFRPHVIRTAERGWVRVFNNDYFHKDLILVDGEQVQVAFDIHCAENVIVRSLDGRFLCEAVWNGNKRDAFPKAFVEKAREERGRRRLKLKEEQVDEIRAEMMPAIEVKESEGAVLLRQMRMARHEEEIVLEDASIAIFQADFKRQKKVG